MIFDNAVQQALATKEKAVSNIVKLGKVTSISGGLAIVQHYGDSAASTKQYTYIDGYFPEVNDIVAMLPQGNTWIIIGKVCDSAPVEKYATKTYVDDNFLPVEYKSKIESSSHSLTISNADLIPSANNAVNLGTSSAAFKNAYIQRVIGSLSNTASANTLEWTSNTVFAPSANNGIELGSSSKQFNAVYTNKIYLNGTEFTPSGISINKLTSKYNTTTKELTFTAGYSDMTLIPNYNNQLNIGSATYKCANFYYTAWHNGTRYVTFDSSHQLVPDTTNAVSLGTSQKQYKNIYGQNIYVNGTAVSSDRRVKENIKDLEEKHLAFFKALRPVQFKYKEGDSGRTHTGFIAQEVEEAVEEAGMTSQDMAVVVKDPSDRYYLRYEEIISVQTKVIQDLMAKVESLEARITKLEGKGENK